ncbi:NADH-quinone oxidoreductase subunit H [Mucilaginibacter rubeus]|uniref:NADH-quinone oxidoreductase subunit H n=1 Tax=Mucilaginibacter rubeus TaxID=2027860 RepID=A0AAE6JH71_9SPHI|nr:complex I subunit 1 family protein [Mucilaginibacter rubeus]QEM05386.1 NADH-quinone oxidoreductase subunit H [Mucilaginibacter rubeus]QTE45492.1 NADH-quinone oxidoreductase subunit H [Mucilaginibacter rubeus]QTE52089.1 NADH-quinone oxidoreductase subunit H [Mucilaginibacter rubeus]QTE57177.1 NADH-quinone oxidoreductase subunit H [Mucilaginibacter rubeus]QTE63360.1 NADH-quinone oxidoreductase subunit H [Mucilaginibacter rubeus]
MNYYFTYFIAAIGLFSFSAFFALFGVYAERKISAFIQDRLGPTETGKYGSLQTLADILKMLQKELIVPAAADRWLFMLAPAVIFIAVYLGFAALPWAPGLIPSKTNIGLYYIFAIISIETLGILMAGWGSNNKYSILGAMRSAAQIISYEIPAGFAIISVVMIAQTLDLQVISAQQGILAAEKIKFAGFWDVSQIGGLFSWNVFRAPHLLIAFVIYFIASLAESNRAPFDIPEAESELVAGFHTEFTGIRFALVFLAEYSMMFLVSMIAVILFLGAWNTPLPNIGGVKLATWTTGVAWGILWVVLKTLGLVGVQMWIRWTLPRLRVDQLMNLCWKVLTPVAFACMLVSGVWRLWVM